MSNLAHALQAPNRALAGELNEPWVDPNVVARARLTARKQIAGIDVVDGGVVNAELAPHRDARRQRIEQYHADRDALVAKLAAVGIVLDADRIVPTQYWHRVCKDVAGLFRLRPDSKGMVHVDNAAFADIPALAEERIAQRLTNAMVLAGSVCVVVPAGLVITGAIGPWGWLAIATSPFAAYAAGWLAQKWNYYKESRSAVYASVRERVESGIARRRFADEGQTRHMLWPNLIEPASGPKLSVNLPEAPADVQETLVKAMNAGLQLELAAAPEAIGFADPVKLFLDEREGAYHRARSDVEAIARQRELEREFRRQQLRDPIATTSFGTATAILAQYGGDFPAEAEAINALVASPELLI